MGPIARTASIGAVAVWLGAMPVASQAPPQEATGDTPQYCLLLLDRVSEMVRIAQTPPPQEVTFLSSEGRRMCDQGQTRRHIAAAPGAGHDDAPRRRTLNNQIGWWVAIRFTRHADADRHPRLSLVRSARRGWPAFAGHDGVRRILR
jgi:hypothetical protein